MDAPLYPLIARHLLPLHGLEVTLRFLAPAYPRFFHQSALTAFLRHLLDRPEGYDRLLVADAPESGRTRYRPGDRYRFAVVAAAGGEGLLARLAERLAALPGSARRSDPALPFGANLALAELRHLYSGRPWSGGGGADPLTAERLMSEAALWSAGAAGVRLRWLSPVQLLLPKERRDGRKGDDRYCRAPADLTPALLGERIHDTFADLLRRRGVTPPPRTNGSAATAPAGRADLFWVDAPYRDAAGRDHPMGGLLGWLEPAPERLPQDAAGWLPWVVGQYLGIGQRRAFGWGRYRLEGADGGVTAYRPAPAASLTERAAEEENLRTAWRAIEENRRGRRVEEEPLGEDEDDGEGESATGDEAIDEEREEERLGELAALLAAGRYRPPPLHGVVIRDRDGGLRPLAVPPFRDRVLQRAVAQSLTPALDPLMSERSYGYRTGRSRQQARGEIERAWREGYRWVYEADIEDFFDSVDWARLATRLHGLFGDDPVVESILDWMAAPVEYDGQHIERRAGLPQGAPLSPLMANLMLDDLDGDLEAAGFRLVRFADDFVVLCRDRAQAEAAARAVRASLAEAGLSLNEEKSRVAPFEQGFRYLGYLFVGGLSVEARPASGGAKAEAAPPPQSWLARLAARPARPLEEGGRLPVRPEPPESSALGEADALGALVVVSGPPTTVATRDDRLRLLRGEQELASLPWQGVGALLLLGPQQLTTPALRAAFAHDVPVHFASGGGSYQGSAGSGRPGAAGPELWLRQQQRFADPAAALGAAGAVVRARLRHQREVLRQWGPRETAEEIAALDRTLEALAGADDLATLHGLEGNAARLYFAALARRLPPELGFAGRNRRPPRDPFNALLSLGYTLLYARTDTLLRVAGLYPWLGFYHQGHGRHASLASDLMEPFRHLVERAALAAVGRDGLTEADFRHEADGGCRLAEGARRAYLERLAERFATPVRGLQDDEARPLEQHLHHQNQRLIDWIDGRVPAFIPWSLR